MLQGDQPNWDWAGNFNQDQQAEQIPLELWFYIVKY